MPAMLLPLEDHERQTVLLALAILALERPGWVPAGIVPIVSKFDGDDAAFLFESFMANNRDRRLRVDSGMVSKSDDPTRELLPNEREGLKTSADEVRAWANKVIALTDAMEHARTVGELQHINAQLDALNKGMGR